MKVLQKKLFVAYGAKDGKKEYTGNCTVTTTEDVFNKAFLADLQDSICEGRIQHLIDAGIPKDRFIVSCISVIGERWIENEN